MRAESGRMSKIKKERKRGSESGRETESEISTLEKQLARKQVQEKPLWLTLGLQRRCAPLMRAWGSLEVSQQHWR